MASIEFKTFTIDPVQGSDQVSVQVGYVVSGSNFDVATGQEYREVCHLIGDDTPGDGTDDNLRKIFENTTVFSANAAHFTRAIQLFLPRSALDEDSGKPFLEEDEIRARVKLIPLPPKTVILESNLITIGGLNPPTPG